MAASRTKTDYDPFTAPSGEPSSGILGHGFTSFNDHEPQPCDNCGGLVRHRVKLHGSPLCLCVTCGKAEAKRLKAAQRR